MLDCQMFLGCEKPNAYFYVVPGGYRIDPYYLYVTKWVIIRRTVKVLFIGRTVKWLTIRVTVKLLIIRITVE